MIDRGLPVVQCVDVQRAGTVLAGRAVTLRAPQPADRPAGHLLNSAGRHAATPARPACCRLPDDPAQDQDPAPRPSPRSPLTAAPAAAQSAVSTPSAKTLYRNGPSGPLPHGRHLAAQARQPSRAARSARPARRAGRASTVPNAWNAGDDSDASFARRRRLVPQGLPLPEQQPQPLAGSCASSRSTTARGCGSTASRSARTRGAYLPFEFRLPKGAHPRRRVNRLVVRVDSRRLPTDFPPAGLSTTGVPTGGWWNYGGLLREVYLRAVDDVDFNTVVVRPNLAVRDVRRDDPLPRHAAQLRRQGAAGPRSAARFGSRGVNLGTQGVGAEARSRRSRAASRIAKPRLWSPDRPTLYNAPLTRSARAGSTLQRYTLRTGIRSIKVVGGHLFLNGRPLNFRGVALHEDTRSKGFAIDNEDRDQQHRLGQGARRDA